MTGSGHSNAGAATLPVLVLNGGSSSIKFSLYDVAGSLTLLYEGEASGIHTPAARMDFFAVRNGARTPHASAQALHPPQSFSDAVQQIAALLRQPEMPQPVAIGHRVVHGGPNLVTHQQVTPQVLAEIEQAVTLAPLHQPIALEILHLALRIFADVPHFVCFDTAFHQTMPPASYTYPVPAELRARGIRRYGFHGISFESIVQQFHDARVPLVAGSAALPQRMVVAHLGSGVSITALRNGQSIDTTMGLTPCGGMLMGTRPGDLDPGLVFYLLRQQTGSAAEAVNAVERALNKTSGLLALSGLSNDMRLLRAAAEQGNAQAALAIEVFVERAQKTIGGYIALLGGLDALVFTAGIGEHDARTRAAICRTLGCMGIQLDEASNAAAAPKARRISAAGSSVAVYVLPAEEDRTIAAHIAASLRSGHVAAASALPQAQPTC